MGIIPSSVLHAQLKFADPTIAEILASIELDPHDAFAHPAEDLMHISGCVINRVHRPLEKLNVIIGPNGTGKSRLLSELYHKAISVDMNPKFWGDSLETIFEITPEDKKEFLSSLQLSLENGTESYYPKNGYNQSGKNVARVPKQLVNKDDVVPERGLPDIDGHIRKEQTVFNHVERRFDVNWMKAKTSYVLPAESPLDVLHRNPALIAKASEIINDLFGLSLLVSDHADPVIEIFAYPHGVPAPPIVDPSDRVASASRFQHWASDNDVTNVQMNGHGVRAFINIYLDIVRPESRVVFIDEPELHLYPSIKRKLGRHLAELAKGSGKQFIMVTHDTDFLTGLADSGEKINVLSIATGPNRIRSVNQTVLNSLGIESASKLQADILRIGLCNFSVICEGVKDRLIYESVFAKLQPLPGKELNFIGCGGKNNTASAAEFAQRLGAKYAVILDFDTIIDSKDCHFFESISGDTRIVASIEALAQKLRGIPNIRKIGVRAIIDESLRRETLTFINSLNKFHIFVSPNGTLESWDDSLAPESFIDMFLNKLSRGEVPNDLREFIGAVAASYGN